MKLLLALLGVALLGSGIVACGRAGDDAGSTVHTFSDATVSGAGSSSSTRRLRGDEDDDDGNESKSYRFGATPSDGDADPDNDYEDNAEKGYYDQDDGVFRDYGRAPSAPEERGLTALVESYYAAALEGNGLRACSMLDQSFSKAIPEDYGRVQGPRYLRGGESCPAVMSLLFKHDHRVLAAGTKVLGVRVDGDRAFALIGSTAVPASSLNLEREKGGVWRIVGLLGQPLP